MTGKQNKFCNQCTSLLLNHARLKAMARTQAACDGGGGGARLEPVYDFVEHLLDVLLVLADDLVPHPCVDDAERLVLAPGAPAEFLDAGRVADGVLGAMHDEERQLHVLEPLLQVAADAEMSSSAVAAPWCGAGWRARACASSPHLEGALGDVAPGEGDAPGGDDLGGGGEQVLDRPRRHEPCRA